MKSVWEMYTHVHHWWDSQLGLYFEGLSQGCNHRVGWGWSHLKAPWGSVHLPAGNPFFLVVSQRCQSRPHSSPHIWGHKNQKWRLLGPILEAAHPRRQFGNMGQKCKNNVHFIDTSVLILIKEIIEQMHRERNAGKFFMECHIIE